MAKKSNNQQGLKKYITTLRDLIDNKISISKKKLLKLQIENNLTEDELNTININSESDYESSLKEYEVGNWDKALIFIDEAISKNPTTYKFLELKINILYELIKILGKNEEYKQGIKILYSMIKRVDFIKFLLLKKKYLKKVDRKWFLLLLLLLIPIYFIIFPLEKKTKSTFNNITPTIELKPGEVYVETDIIRHKSQIEVKVLKSILTSSSNNFSYNLQFNINSTIENILNIEGSIIWYNDDNEIIFKENFNSPTNREYFINENIPFYITKNSQRESPKLNKVVIKITKILSQEGKERENKKKLDIIYPINQNWKIEAHELLYKITKGVTKNYLTIDIMITNNDKREIKVLVGNIQWLNDYDIESFSTDINLIKKNEIPLFFGESRLIHKTIEIQNITTKYRVNIKEIR